MSKVTLPGLIIFTSLFLNGCSTIPISDACNHLDEKVTVEGFLEFTDCYVTVGSFALPSTYKTNCVFNFHEETNLQGYVLELWLKLGYPFPSSDLKPELCGDNPGCNLEGTQKFRITGQIYECKQTGTSTTCIIKDNACGISVDSSQDIKPIP